MNYFFVRCAYPWLSIVLFGIIVLIMLMRKKIHKVPLYRYSLGTTLKNNNAITSHPHRTILYGIRFLILCLLAIIISKPQLVDVRSKTPIEGIDIVLVLDVSGSMRFQDDENDIRSRFDIAKAEAIHFIEKRDNDALGLVLFGKDTISRCPITSDKQMLKQVVEEIKLGVIDPDGTMLITGMITAANRLKYSSAKSKVMIVLTDGEPSEGDMDVSVGIEVAKKLGIKIYTIGIGSEDEVMFMHPLYGLMAKPKLNKELLIKIAHETGGQYFMARSATDMRRIYDTIDELEKTEHEVPLFTLYYDMVILFVSLIIALIFLELLLSTFMWFAL